MGHLCGDQIEALSTICNPNVILPSIKKLAQSGRSYDQPRFGGIIDENMQLNNLGKMVSKQWNDLPNRFPNIALDQFIVMPNHIHGIVQLVGAPLAGARVPNAVSRNNYHSVWFSGDHGQ